MLEDDFPMKLLAIMLIGKEKKKKPIYSTNVIT